MVFQPRFMGIAGNKTARRRRWPTGGRLSAGRTPGGFEAFVFCAVESSACFRGHPVDRKLRGRPTVKAGSLAANGRVVRSEMKTQPKTLK